MPLEDRRNPWMRWLSMSCGEMRARVRRDTRIYGLEEETFERPGKRVRR